MTLLKNTRGRGVPCHSSVEVKDGAKSGEGCSKKFSLSFFLVGLLIPFNFIVFFGSSNSPRIMDLALVLSPMLLLLNIQRVLKVSKINVAVYFIVWCMLAFHLIQNIGIDDYSDAVLSARWFLSIPLCLFLSLGLVDKTNITSLCFGTIAGSAANVTVLIAQVLGYSSFLRETGLLSARNAMDLVVGSLGIQRYTGMWEHPNASMAVVSLAVPAALWLYRQRVLDWRILAFSWGLVLLGFTLTQSRSPLVCAAIITVLGLIFNASILRRIAFVCFVLLVVAGIALYGPPGGWGRWSGAENIGSNAQGRIDTTIESLSMTLEAPLGRPLNDIHEKLMLKTGLSATHNGFLLLGALFGPFVTFVIIFYMFRPFFRRKNDQNSLLDFHRILSGFIGLLYMFEEHPVSPVFAIFTVLCVVLPSDRVNNKKSNQIISTL